MKIRIGGVCRAKQKNEAYKLHKLSRKCAKKKHFTEEEAAG